MNRAAPELVWQISFGDGYAGSHKFALLTTQYMKEHGYEAEIVVTRNSLTEQRALSRDLRTHSIDTSRDRDEVFAELKSLYEARQPVIILSHHSLERKLTMRLKRMYGRRFINIAFRNAAPLGVPFLGAVPYNLWFDYHIACSAGVARSLRRIGIRSSRIKIVHNGIEIPDSIPTNNMLRQQLGIAVDDKVIGLSTWYHRKRKGFDLLFEAIAGLSEFPFKLLIVGPPKEHRQFIFEMAKEYDISPDTIILPGYVENIWEYYNLMDIFVLPSRAEGFSLALLEAMACGVPVIVSNIPGNNEIVSDGVTGLLFDISDPRGLTRGIEQILMDKILAADLSIAGKNIVVENYTIDHIGKKYTEELMKILKTNRVFR